MENKSIRFISFLCSFYIAFLAGATIIYFKHNWWIQLSILVSSILLFILFTNLSKKVNKEKEV